MSALLGGDEVDVLRHDLERARAEAKVVRSRHPEWAEAMPDPKALLRAYRQAKDTFVGDIREADDNWARTVKDLSVAEREKDRARSESGQRARDVERKLAEFAENPLQAMKRAQLELGRIEEDERQALVKEKLA